jgi:hypothetical protein
MLHPSQNDYLCYFKYKWLSRSIELTLVNQQGETIRSEGHWNELRSNLLDVVLSISNSKELRMSLAEKDGRRRWLGLHDLTGEWRLNDQHSGKCTLWRQQAELAELRSVKSSVPITIRKTEPFLTECPLIVGGLPKADLTLQYPTLFPKHVYQQLPEKPSPKEYIGSFQLQGETVENYSFREEVYVALLVFALLLGPHDLDTSPP